MKDSYLLLLLATAAAVVTCKPQEISNDVIWFPVEGEKDVFSSIYGEKFRSSATARGRNGNRKYRRSKREYFEDDFRQTGSGFRQHDFSSHEYSNPYANPQKSHFQLNHLEPFDSNVPIEFFPDERNPLNVFPLHPEEHFFHHKIHPEIFESHPDSKLDELTRPSRQDYSFQSYDEPARFNRRNTGRTFDFSYVHEIPNNPNYFPEGFNGQQRATSSNSVNRPSGGGNFNGQNGFDGPNKPGGFNGPNGPSGYNRPNEPGGFNGPNGPNTPDGFNGPNRPGGFNGQNRPGGFSGQNAPDGFDGQNSPGGFNGQNTPGGFDGPNGLNEPNRPGGINGLNEPDGYNRPNRPDGSNRPSRPDSFNSPSGGTGSNRPSRPDSYNRPNRPDGSNRPSRPDSYNRPNRPDGSKRPSRPDSFNRPSGGNSPSSPNGYNNALVFPGEANNGMTTTTTVSPTTAPSRRTTTPNPCERSCAVTPEFNPVCGTDTFTYSNMGRLNCARNCGKSVSVLHLGNCRRMRLTIPPVLAKVKK